MEPFGKLVLTVAGEHEQEYLLEKTTIILGRGTTSDIALSDAKISRAHARLECNATGCTLIDLGSANGIRINGIQVERALLAPGDLIGLGDSTLRFAVSALASEPELIAIDSEADLEATLKQATVPMTLTNTDVPRLAIHTPERTWEVLLTEESLSIGRHAGSDLVLDQPQASRHHARIERIGDGFRLRDLGSTNGTWLGNGRVTEAFIQNGDTIRIGDAQCVFKAGFGVEELTLVAEPQLQTNAALQSPRSPIVFVPGMMGSELWRGSERLWPNVKVMFTDPEIFRVTPENVMEPRGIVGEMVFVPNFLKQQHYSRLGDFLEEALGYERRRDLLEFAYDWRQDLRLSAQRLAQAIDSWGVTQPITLIAHSLGCIVSRYYVERLGGKHKVGRL
ncbi:MAG TPA: FHA domain-containing protein, partial [Caldilineaceae bacterium]|nr:FHA domain-containing protein [Caldilineaceae bacterium]